MEKQQLTRECLGKVYREFSRQMYNKYKHQFPKMRESEIVRKIIKDWESLNYLQKEALNERYVASNSIREDDNPSPYSTAKKNYNEISDTAAKTVSPTPHKTIRVTVYPPLFPARPEYDNDSEYNRYSERPSEDQKSDRSSYSVDVNKKSSPFSRQKQYIGFYRYHYSKLAQEHSKWSSKEISQIIKLMWKKEAPKKEEQRAKRKAKKTKHIAKPISGRKWFFLTNRRNGFTRVETRFRWKKLPFESRKLCGWRALGRNPENKLQKAMVRVYRSRNLLMMK